ncbi:YdcF family protein [Alphaproteobacteria bacterium]|nr:YdcF family protein [Alphaproteobacteria bacterium]
MASHSGRIHIINSLMVRFRTVSLAQTKMAAKSLLIVLLLGCAFFMAGLQHFVLTLPKPAPPTTASTTATDGIVVITGGQQRLADGFNLLQSGAGKALLVSGVGQGVSKTILADELKLNPREIALLTCCVTLEFQAGDTRENAVAAGKWAQENGFTSLQLVTANYHMPRAKAIFTRTLPDIALSYWPVSPKDLDLDIWWKTPPIIRLLAREYAKYLTEPIANLILTRIND